MIIGIGTDLCDVNRIQKSAESQAFVSRVFSTEEIEYAEKFGEHKEEHLAASFAAKEAFVKALGTGFRALGPLDICVRHNDLGAPEFVLSDKARATIAESGVKKAHLSLSHEGEYALAYVILEG